MSDNTDKPVAKPALLMTRQSGVSEAFVARLDPALLEGVTVCHSPLLSIDAIDGDIDTTPFDAVIFTSANGVRFAPDGAGQTAFCVGARTADHARRRGWRVFRVATDADDLVTKMSEVEGRFLHLAGVHRRGDIAGRLGSIGRSVTVQEVYAQRTLPLCPPAVALLSSNTPVLVPLFSPRTAAQFAQEVSAAQHVHVIAISAAVAQALGGADTSKVHIAAAPTGEEMVRAIEFLLRRKTFA